jgi:hypothetical protein
VDDLAVLDHVHRIFEFCGPETAYGSTLETVDRTKGPANGDFTRILMTADDQGTNQSFLLSEVLFRRVKDMQHRNLIVPIVGDFAGEKALQQIAAYLHKIKSTVNVFYVSNVEQYLFQPHPKSPNGGAQKFMRMSRHCLWIPRAPSFVYPTTTRSNRLTPDTRHTLAR